MDKEKMKIEMSDHLIQNGFRDKPHTVDIVCSILANGNYGNIPHTLAEFIDRISAYKFKMEIDGIGIVTVISEHAIREVLKEFMPNE